MLLCPLLCPCPSSCPTLFSGDTAFFDGRHCCAWCISTLQRIQQGRQQQQAAQGGGAASASGGAAPAVYFPPHMRQGQQAAQAQAGTATAVQQDGLPRMATFQGGADPALQSLQDFMDEDFEGESSLVGWA